MQTKEDRALYKSNCITSEMCTRAGCAGTISEGDAVLTLCIDGMDQSKFCCPRHARFQRSKESESYWRPQLHFTGAIAHGLFEYYFVADEDCRKDPQVTIEMLSHVIEEAMKEIKARGGETPQHLVIQVVE